MVNLLICFVLLGVASGSYLPYGTIAPYGGVGYSPYSLGYGRPYYGAPMLGHAGYLNGMSHYSGDGRHYGGLYSNGLGSSSIGASGAMANAGGHGYGGGQRYADHRLGSGGFHSNRYGGDVNSGAGGFNRADGFQNAAGRGTVGGFNDAGHTRGHKTTGFHKSYSNVETGRDSKFVDEDHDLGEHNVGQHFGNNFANAYGSGYRGAGGNGQYGSNRHFNQVGQQGLVGGSYNDANYGGHGANNFYNGQDHSLRNTHLANNMNNFGHGFSGIGSNYGMGGAYAYPW